MATFSKNHKKIIFIILLITTLYYFISQIVFRGSFILEHYYSYDSKEKCIKNNIFISDNLNLKIEGDSLKNTPNLSKKFYSTKSMYQKFYGFLISTKMEDKNYRRIVWSESIKLSKNRNWIITNNGEYCGEAFYVGHCDAKIGDTLILTVENAKTDIIIGTIKIIVE